MAHHAAQLEMKGLVELQRDIQKASYLAPKELNRTLNRISKKFKENIKERAEETYSTTENITSGFTMTRVRSENDILYSYFKPEAKGSKGHAWHLHEHGYELIRPTWRSREKAIRNKDGGKHLRFIPGNHLVDKEVPGFAEYMGEQAYLVVDEILKRNNL